MKILVINGDCLQVNSSANLCHLAYIRGLIDAGHEVTLLSADGKSYEKDTEMDIPKEIHRVTFEGRSLYERLSVSRKKSLAVKNTDKSLILRKSLKQKTIRFVKDTALRIYGVHGIYASFVRRAKHFRSDVLYDVVLSLSHPVTSHSLAYLLLSSGRIKCRRWIQIWEDPWYDDIYGFNKKPKIYREEKRLLSLAESICYVSPITLANQKKSFPESAEKMFWEPLPVYYSTEDEGGVIDKVPCFGYFGDYYPAARNLSPFYESAKRMGIETYICGNSNMHFSSTEFIHVYPRMSLKELRPFEERANILVYLCNRKGGQIPGKIYQYSATSKAILFILDGTDEEKNALREYFEPFKRYYFCENTIPSIETTLRRIINNDYQDISNEPLTQFKPVEIIQRILQER